MESCESCELVCVVNMGAAAVGEAHEAPVLSSRLLENLLLRCFLDLPLGFPGCFGHIEMLLHHTSPSNHSMTECASILLCLSMSQKAQYVCKLLASKRDAYPKEASSGTPMCAKYCSPYAAFLLCPCKLSLFPGNQHGLRSPGHRSGCLHIQYPSSEGNVRASA